MQLMTAGKTAQSNRLPPLTLGTIANGGSYIMNHDYEPVPGIWYRGYFYQGKVLVEKEFIVSEEFND